MEVRIDVLNQEKEIFCTAFYVFVAKTKEGKSHKVPKLMCYPGYDSKIFQDNYKKAEERQKDRKEASSSSIYKVPPNLDEIKLLHEFFLQKYAEKNDVVQEIPIKSTRVEKTLLKHFQDQNVQGTVFGGYVMRESLELSFVCAFGVGSGQMPKIFKIDDIHFIAPIEVGKINCMIKLGSVIRYIAYVTYSEKKIVNVKVIVEKVIRKYTKVSYKKAFEFNVSFFMDRDVPSVYPESYEEAMYYLEGRKRIKNLNN